MQLIWKKKKKLIVEECSLIFADKYCLLYLDVGLLLCDGIVNYNSSVYLFEIKHDKLAHHNVKLYITM